MRLPVEVAAIDHHAADAGAVTADPLGGGVHDDRRTQGQRLAQHRGRGVVHDQRHADLAPECRHFRDREDLQLRVGKGLRVPAAGAGVGRAGKILGVGGVDEADLDAEGLQRICEEVPGAAIEVGAGDDVIARFAQVQHREGRRRLARPQRQARHPAFHRRDALLEHIDGGVHDAGVDVAQLRQPEQPRRMAGILELEGGGLVDRHRDRSGGGIRTPAGVQRDGLGVGPVRGGHRHPPLWRFPVHQVPRDGGARKRNARLAPRCRRAPRDSQPGPRHAIRFSAHPVRRR